MAIREGKAFNMYSCQTGMWREVNFNPDTGDHGAKLWGWGGRVRGEELVTFSMLVGEALEDISRVLFLLRLKRWQSTCAVTTPFRPWKSFSLSCSRRSRWIPLSSTVTTRPSTALQPAARPPQRPLVGEVQQGGHLVLDLWGFLCGEHWRDGSICVCHFSLIPV